LEYLLFAAYLILFAWFVTKVKFFKDAGLSNYQLVILFLLKVMAGIFYGWIGVYYGEMAQMLDTWAYHVESLREYNLLKTHPLEFFTNLFHTSYKGGFAHFLTTHNSWWNDVKANFLIKVMAIFDLFSFGHYYINAIFYAFISLYGPVTLYRVMKDPFPQMKLAVLLASFLIPSFLYWTSGLHKEGLIFLGLSIMIYHFYFGFKEHRFPFYRVALILLGFFMVLILRNFLVITLLPPLISWILSRKLPIRPIWVYLTVSALFIVFFFTAKYISPGLDFPLATAIKQQEFLQLGGGSAVPVHLLEPSFKGFVRNGPQALAITAIRPYPSDVRHLLSMAAALEINFLLLLFLLFLIWRKPVSNQNSFILFCIFLSFAIMMMIGYSVNVLGAIVRYRSIVLPLLVVPMVAMTDWNKILALASKIIRNNNNT
jgi:hypothetical protein